MNTIDNVRNAIQGLRDKGAANDELIDAACRLLFMQTGELPSQSRVLDLVRIPGSSPSASTVQKGINKFWATIRQRIGVSLSHPQVPQEVLEQIGESVSRMWDAAINGADQALSTRKQELENEFEKKSQECDIEVAQSRSALEAAKENEARALDEATKAREEATNAMADMEAAKRDLGIANGINENLESQLVEVKETINTLNQQIEAARQDTERKLTEADALLAREQDKWQSEVTKLKSSLQTCDDTIMRLRLDVDREISRSENYRKDLATAKNEIQEITRSASIQERDHKNDILRMTGELSELKGRYAALDTERTSLETRVDELLRANAVLEHEKKVLQEKFSTPTKAMSRKSKAKTLVKTDTEQTAE